MIVFTNFYNKDNISFSKNVYSSYNDDFFFLCFPTLIYIFLERQFKYENIVYIGIL